MKPCTLCKEVKPFCDYYADKRTSSGCYAACRQCTNSRKNKYPRKRYGYLKDDRAFPPTPERLAHKRHASMRARAGKPGSYLHVKLLFTKDELTKYFEDHWEHYMALYTIWKKSGFKFKYTPSIDRIDNKGHYSVDNIQIIPQWQNAQKDRKGMMYTAEHKQRIGISTARRHQRNRDVKAVLTN